MSKLSERGDIVRLITINITSAKNHLEKICGLDATALILQELALTDGGQREMTEWLQQQGKWRPLWGHPQPGRAKYSLSSHC